ncbi:MAG: hypothetical protein WCP03_01170 [Candidatus Saccharibacteria bacterium]
MSLVYELEMNVKDELIIESEVEGLTLPERVDADVADVNAKLHKLGSSALNKEF